MSDSNQSRFSVSADEIRKYDWQSRLAQHSHKECWSYCEVFAVAAKEHEAAGDDIGRRVYALLHIVASFHPNYDANGNPYGPRQRNTDGTRSMMAEDLADTDLDAMRAILEEITDAEYRARVGDVLWENKRDYKAAEIAVRAFLESANLQKTADLWPPYTDRLERAAQLAAKLGFGKSLHMDVVAIIEAGITEFENNLNAGLLCNRLMMIALAHNATDTARYAALCERLAKAFAVEGNWDFSEAYWQLAGNWHQRTKNIAKVQCCQLAAAECLVSKAEKSLENKKFGLGYAAHWMGCGVKALRQAKADPNRIKQVHLRFLELEREALNEMSPMYLNVDGIPGFRESEEKTQEAARAHVRGYDFEHAVTRLALITEPIDTDTVKKQIESQSKEFIWDKIVGTSSLDHSGKVADTLSHDDFGLPDVEKDAMRKKMALHARQIYWPMQVAWKIEPARITIRQEHGIRLRDLFWIVVGNPFIPPGHERMYVRGLQAGFFGDWLISMHLLIPQCEASLRHVLQQRGVITSTLEPDGTQKERDLNQLLWMPELESVFGHDIMFDLCGILIDRFGHNMRNESAHGLMPEGAFYQPASVYLWWIILRLCWIGYRLIQSCEK